MYGSLSDFNRLEKQNPAIKLSNIINNFDKDRDKRYISSFFLAFPEKNPNDFRKFLLEVFPIFKKK